MPTSVVVKINIYHNRAYKKIGRWQYINSFLPWESNAKWSFKLFWLL